MSQGFPTETTPVQPEGKKSGGGRTVTIILVVLGLIGGVCALCCCGGVGMFYFGMNEMAKQVQTKYADDETVVEYIGGIESCAFNFGDTISEQQRREDTWVFDVEGPSGSGQLILWAPSGQPSDASEAVLRQGGADFPLGAAGISLDEAFDTPDN